MMLDRCSNSLKVWSVVLGIALSLSLLTGTALIMQPARSESATPTPDEPTQYLLDVQQPEKFLKEHLSRVFQPPEYGYLWTGVIDKDITIIIRNADKSVTIPAVLVDGVRMTDTEYYIQIIGAEGDLNDVFNTAWQICQVVNIPDNKIVAWLLRAAMDPDYYSDVLQMGKSAGVEHSVTLQKALLPRPGETHSLRYTIYFEIDDETETSFSK